MSVSAANITVSTVAVLLTVAETDTVSGSQVLLKNTSANAADLGPASVTAGAGFGLAAGASLQIVLPPGEAIYAIRSAASDATISVLRIGV